MRFSFFTGQPLWRSILSLLLMISIAWLPLSAAATPSLPTADVGCTHCIHPDSAQTGSPCQADHCAMPICLVAAPLLAQIQNRLLPVRRDLTGLRLQPWRYGFYQSPLVSRLNRPPIS